MYCKVCGSEENVKFYPNKLQALCKFCADETPNKVGFDRFVSFYFPGDDIYHGEVPYSTKKEFYDDYRTSTYNLENYKQATSVSVD
jgi:hypothetical protein